MPDCIDLTHNVDVTTTLLMDPLAWRIRVVEQIDVDSPISALRRRSLQCAPLRPVVAAAADLATTPPHDAQSALLVVPVAPIPKGPLLEFDIVGPEGSDAFLLPRSDIARIEAAFVREEAARAGIAVSDALADLIDGALGFSEAQWQEYRPDLTAYLAAGVGLPEADPHVEAWVALSAEAATVLAPFTETPEPLNSAIENPALVAPALIARGAAGTPAEVTTLLAAYVEMLREAAAIAASTHPKALLAGDLLSTLTEYGSHYDLMAVVRVPLDEPFVIKVSDRRPLQLRGFSNAGEQSLVLADARSNHIALRITDPNARLPQVKARAMASDLAAYGTFTYQTTPQVHSAYAFDPDRDYRIRLTFHVGLLRRLQLVAYVLGGLLFVLAGLVAKADPGPRELALLVGPGSLAASVLLARESSALASRLRLFSNAWLVAGLTAVFIAATWRYVQT